MMRLIPQGYEPAAPGTMPEAASDMMAFADFSPDPQPALACFTKMGSRARQRSGA